MTPQQHTTLAFIRDFSREFGHAPTLEEIGAALGIRSKGAVHRLVQALVAKGHLAREPGWRGLRLAEPAEKQSSRHAIPDFRLGSLLSALIRP